MPIKPAYRAATDIGHRNENQDRFVVLDSPDAGQYLYLVADGMGGHRGGAEAAQCVIDSCRQLWQSQLQKIVDIEGFLQQLVERAHEAVAKINQQDFPDAQSTLAALFISGEEYVSVHVGDCRVYQFNGERLVKRTVDQSLAQLAVLQGKINEKDLATHPDQNKVYSSIGGHNPPSPIIQHYAGPGDCFVICSDGFWEMFEESAMPPLGLSLHSSADLKSAICQRMPNFNEHDNTTAIFVKLSSDSADLSLSQGGERPAPAKKSQISLVIGVVLILAAVGLFFVLPENAEAPQSEGPGESTSQASESSGSEQLAEKTTSADKATIPSTRLSLEIEVKDTDDAAVKIGDVLRQQGKLSKDDNLKVTQSGRRLGDSEIVRQQQEHKGIPVFGAEVVSILKDGKLTSIEAKTLADINISTEPALTVEEALKIAEKEMAQKLNPLDQGALIILKTSDSYLLAWMVSVEKSNAEHVILMLDANNGSVLDSIPLITEQES